VSGHAEAGRASDHAQVSAGVQQPVSGCGMEQEKMMQFAVVTASEYREGRTTVGPYTDWAEAQRAMTRVAEQGFSINGSRQAFERVTILKEEEQ